jgi:hypothetical protein
MFGVEQTSAAATIFPMRQGLPALEETRARHITRHADHPQSSSSNS